MPTFKRLPVFVVDTDARFGSMLRSVSREAGHTVIALGTFQRARRELNVRVPAALIANVRLGEFNGIHLAYLAKSVHPDLRVMVYAQPHDLVLARDVQQAGAFYERQLHAPYAVKPFLSASLPRSDRRDTNVVDRRSIFRPGRRVSDLAMLHAHG